MGWFGNSRAILNYLSVVGADKDSAGKFLIGGEPVISGLDPNEIVVPSGSFYLVDGKKKNLAAGLRGTSQGMGIKVF